MIPDGLVLIATAGDAASVGDARFGRLRVGRGAARALAGGVTHVARGLLTLFIVHAHVAARRQIVRVQVARHRRAGVERIGVEIAGVQVVRVQVAGVEAAARSRLHVVRAVVVVVTVIVAVLYL